MADLQHAYVHALKIHQSLADLSGRRADIKPALNLSDELVRELGRIWAMEDPDDQTELRP